MTLTKIHISNVKGTENTYPKSMSGSLLRSVMLDLNNISHIQLSSIVQGYVMTLTQCPRSQFTHNQNLCRPMSTSCDVECGWYDHPIWLQLVLSLLGITFQLIKAKLIRYQLATGDGSHIFSSKPLCETGYIRFFPIIYDARGLRPDMLRFPYVCVMTFTLGL